MRQRCARCPRYTNQGRIICAICDKEQYRARTGYRPPGRPAKDDLPPDQIEAIYRQAMHAIQVRRRLEGQR